MLQNYLKNKSIAIYGMGLEGKSTLNFLLKHNITNLIYLVDDKADLTSFLSDNIFIADKNIFNDVDIIIKSPGIDLKNDFKYFDKLESQTSLFLKYYQNQTIGITGTKGKSTTTSLIYHILKNTYKNVILAGNIGKPVFDSIDLIDSDTYIIYELSCHQLQYLKTSPKFSIFLNCYEEHLDRYGTFLNYLSVKENIYRFQNDKCYTFINDNLKIINDKSTIYLLNKDIDIRNKVIYFKNNCLDLTDVSISLVGKHNFINIAFVYALIKEIFVLSDYDFIENLKTFKSLDHRLEYVGKFNGINFYNDSISTSVESTLAGIEALAKVKTVILGGLDRGITYDLLHLELEKNKELKNIILTYGSGKRIYDSYNFVNKKVYYVNDLIEAIKLSFQISKENDIVLFSPASASYDSFKDFADRGNFFKKNIYKISLNEEMVV